MCPVLFPTQINSISLISNGPFWDLQAVFKQGLRLGMPLRSRVPSATDAVILHSARALIPITWDELAGSFSSHARTGLVFFFYIQVSEFNTADTIPLLFKGKIFPFISRPLYIITQSKPRAERCAATPRFGLRINSFEKSWRYLCSSRKEFAPKAPTCGAPGRAGSGTGSRSRAGLRRRLGAGEALRVLVPPRACGTPPQPGGTGCHAAGSVINGIKQILRDELEPGRGARGAEASHTRLPGRAPHGVRGPFWRSDCFSEA